MPLPKPNADESQKDYISRCMGNATVVKDFPDEKQRLAVCYAQWRDRAEAKPDAEPDAEPDADPDDRAANDPDDPEDTEDLAERDGDKPYGDVAYADPGYQSDGKKRYPIDTADHTKAAWSYINQEKNANKYSADQLSKIKAKIKSAAKKFGIEIAEDTKSTAPRSRVRPRDIPTEHVFASAKLSLRAAQVAPIGGLQPLPDGVCGRLTGVALTYNTIDDYGTMFLPGSLSRTRSEAVANGKVKLLADHGPFTDTHVGTVRAIDDVGDSALLTADLFDTEPGRAMKEYLEAVLASGSDTGLSIGFRPIDKEWRSDPDGGAYLAFKEIALREVSITPVPAVPGTNVTSVRREAGEAPGEGETDLLRRALRNILAALPEREARDVFDAAYPVEHDGAGAGRTDTTVARTGAASDAGRGTESATGIATLATVEDRVRALRTAVAR